MSESGAAFIKVQIARAALVRWLHDTPSPASRWSDWPDVSGRWPVEGVSTFAALGPGVLADVIGAADNIVARFPDNHRLLLHLITDPLGRQDRHFAAFDRAGGTFLAGTLAFSEALTDVVTFLAFARGVADHLAAGDHGIAIVRDYVWSHGDPRVTVAALDRTPFGASRLPPKDGGGGVAPRFDAGVATLIERHLAADDPVGDGPRILH